MAVDKYLSRYAEPELEALPTFSRIYQNVLVIPARDEAVELLAQLERLDGNFLCILVINSEAGNEQEQQLANYLISQNQSGHSLYPIAKNSDLLLIDRYTPGFGIPKDEGVGLARKIGCDIACKLINEGRITSNWIHTSDADAQWPAEYFAAAKDQQGAALLYPFEHATGEHAQAMLLYEFSLNYYVAGLSMAGSPYAYHTVGSTLAIDYRHYAQVRGFPKKSGGEDFYILNKLRKTGEIKTLHGQPLILADRLSHRVPFGTGPALQKLVQLDNPVKEFTLYNPESFELLKQWLGCIPKLFELGSVEAASTCLKQSLCSTNLAMLEQLGFDTCLQHAFKQGRTSSSFQRHIHDWFDAFRTLKAIHFYRDNGYPNMAFIDLIQMDSFLKH